jgi:radical SAM protein with 4Fe4S-binding SPASM domain
MAKGLEMPAEMRLIEVDGQLILYNPDLHTWCAVTAEELRALRALESSQTDPDHSVPESLLRLVVNGLLYISGSPPVREKTVSFPTSPQAVYWTVTQRCNLRCVYCFAEASPAHHDELDTATSLIVADSIASAEPKWVFFTGGEPMVRPDLYELAGRCKKHGIRTGLLTNATLIDHRAAEAIASTFDSVAVSLDSAEPSLHDALRGKGTHARTVQGIALLIQSGTTPSVNTTVTSMNIGDVMQLARLMRDMGVTEHRLSVHMPVGRGSSDGLECEPEQLASLLQDILRDGTWKELKRKSPATFQSYLPKRFRPKCQCGLGTNEVSVDHTGTVYPCRLLNGVPEMVAGNVLRNSLAEIYRESPVLLECRSLTVEDIPGCSACTYRYFCGGGCRALAYHNCGDLQAQFSGMCAITQLEFDFLLTQETAAAHGGDNGATPAKSKSDSAA